MAGAPTKPTPPTRSVVSWILLAVLLAAGWAFQGYAANEEATPEIR